MMKAQPRAGLSIIRSVSEPRSLHTMQAYIIAYDFSADLVKDDRDIFNLKMRTRSSPIVICVQVKVHTNLQVGQRAI
jgi:hypothetical protein